MGVSTCAMVVHEKLILDFFSYGIRLSRQYTSALTIKGDWQ